MKSTNGSVLLIPNPYAPAFPIDGDNIDFLDSLFVKGKDGKNTQVNIDKNIRTQDRFKNAENALSNMSKALRTQYRNGSAEYGNNKKGKRGYTGQSIRVDLSKIIALNSQNDASFPDREELYKGHLKNLYVNKNMIVDSLSASRLTIQSLHDILKKISAAAGNVWDFRIIANPINKNHVSIVDINFPGFDKNGNLLNINILRDNFDDVEKSKEYYSFSSIDSNSILRGLDFSVNLPDEIAVQIMMDAGDNNVSRDDEKFFQRTFLSSDSDVVIKEHLNKLVPRASSDHDKLPDTDNNQNEASKYIQTQTDDLYYPVKLDNGDKRITIRLVEPNDEIVSSGINRDNNPFNSIRFNGLVPGITVNLTLTGISGMKFMDVFDIKNLPHPYKPNAIFQITNIKHSWTGNDWSTNVEAMVRPAPSMFLK
jgi:hypothetical protein